MKGNGRRLKRNNGNGNVKSNRPVRCAIYTRKSTNEGLDQDFNTLDAQREAAEAILPARGVRGG